VEVGGGVLGDLAILGLHLMTQPAGIDRVDDLGHWSTLLLMGTGMVFVVRDRCALG
jgi:hypothetical protein